MARIFSTVVRRVTAAIGGAVNWIAQVKPGIAVGTVGNFGTPSEVRSGAAIDATRQANRVAQTPGLAASLLGASGEVPVSQAPAIAASARISEFHVDDVPAAEIVQIKYDLTRRVGANASADVTGTWTSRASAEGIHDGTDATSTGAVTAASRKVRLDYANHINKSDLTITSVKLFLYIQTTGNTGGLLGSVTFSYNIGAGEVIPTGWNARTDTFDFTTTPAEVDLTAAIGGDWSKLDALQTFLLHTYSAASTGFVARVDAVEVEILATATQVL